ncbi:MAG: hypothetical protein F6K31_23425 [Symploca sp. SIO2G7]|nr:hypothetical protein [Symploca sp. SIO2G7]
MKQGEFTEGVWEALYDLDMIVEGDTFSQNGCTHVTAVIVPSIPSLIKAFPAAIQSLKEHGWELEL